MAYPNAVDDILPGNQSFLVIAAVGASSGAIRIDVQNGQWQNGVRSSEYGASDSAWIRKIANKYQSAYTCTVAEEDIALESIAAMGERFDVYVKRSSGSTTYDKLGDALLETQAKELPESGDAHRTIQCVFGGGVYTAGVASGTVPTLAP